MKSKLIIYLGFSGVFGLALAYYFNFIMAYFFNNYIITFNINYFGEAHIELVVFTLLIVLGFVTMTYLLNEFGKEVRNDKK